MKTANSRGIGVAVQGSYTELHRDSAQLVGHLRDDGVEGVVIIKSVALEGDLYEQSVLMR